MSYDIIYSKQFIRLRRTGEIIPMLLSGSNNCFEIGLNGRDGRRARDWSSMRYYNRKGKLSEKPDRILAKLDAELRRYIRRRDKHEAPSDIRKHFGYYSSLVVGGGSCSDTTWEQWRGVFANGIKRALTVEELDKLGVNPYFNAYTRSPDGKPVGIALKTERDYFSELQKWRQWASTSADSFSLSFQPLSTDTVLERLHAPKRKAAKPHVRVEQDHYFVLTDGTSALIRYTSRGYRYSWGKTDGSARHFKTGKDAEFFRQRLVTAHRHKAELWRVERIDRPASF